MLFQRSLTRPALQKDGMPEVHLTTGDLVLGQVKAGCLRSWGQVWKLTSQTSLLARVSTVPLMAQLAQPAHFLIADLYRDSDTNSLDFCLLSV